MSLNNRSIISRVASWLRDDEHEGSQELERLRSEQIRLSSELERLLSSYDSKTRDLATRLVASESLGLDQDVYRLSDEQKTLWKIIRRLQIAERSTPQLEQEYKEWMSRSGSELSETHPDHPSLRAELIASELRSRGKTLPIIESDDDAFEGSAKDANPFEDLQALEDQSFQENTDDSSDDSLSRIASIPVTDEMRQNLLDQIRECGLQIRRRSAQPNIDASDLAEIYAELRSHHTALRDLDRRNGIRRYRLVLHE